MESLENWFGLNTAGLTEDALAGNVIKSVPSLRRTSLADTMEPEAGDQ